MGGKRKNLSLRKYCDNHRGAMSTLARVLHIDLGQLCRLANGKHQMPAKHCLAIERATRGEVTARSLRPDLCWPDDPDDDWPTENEEKDWVTQLDEETAKEFNEAHR